MNTIPTSPRIYVACLAAYNNGHLHGAWFDAARDVWEIWVEVQAMLAASPETGAEEFAIHDYEGFEGVRIGEFASLETVAQIAAFVVEHGRLGAELLSYFGDDLEGAGSAMADSYLGSYPSLADYVQEMTEEAIAVPDGLQFYIDWEAMARDAELSGELFTLSLAHDEVHVFAA